MANVCYYVSHEGDAAGNEQTDNCNPGALLRPGVHQEEDEDRQDHTAYSEASDCAILGYAQRYQAPIAKVCCPELRLTRLDCYTERKCARYPQQKRALTAKWNEMTSVGLNRPDDFLLDAAQAGRSCLACDLGIYNLGQDRSSHDHFVGSVRHDGLSEPSEDDHRDVQADA